MNFTHACNASLLKEKGTKEGCFARLLHLDNNHHRHIVEGRVDGIGNVSHIKVCHDTA
jgi:hypothetical protein